MHRQLYAQCRLELELTALSPLLVQGEQGQGEFYRAIDPADGAEKYCIPATSLKGVWRSAAERILRSFNPELACDPFQRETEGNTRQFCGQRLEKDSRKNSASIVSELCPACHLFGCTVYAGLIRVSTGAVEFLPRYDVVAQAANPLEAGTVLSNDDGFNLKALTYPAQPVEAGTPLPYYMAQGNQLAVDVAAGTIIRTDMVVAPSDSALWSLRAQQDGHFFRE